MSQIVTVTDVIMWRSKWDSGIWQPESSRMAEEWEMLSGGKKKKKLNDLWAGSIIPSSVIPLGPDFLSIFFFSPGFIVHPFCLCLVFQLHIFVVSSLFSIVHMFHKPY